MKTISVIITTFNNQDTIDRCLDSIFKQEGYKQQFDLEILIIDASTDKTVEYIKEYQLTYPIIYYQKVKDKGGPNRQRNIALRKAKGDYIAFIDPDDTWHKSKLNLQLKFIQIFLIVSTGYTVIKKGKEIKRYNNEVNVYYNNDVFLDLLKYNHKKLPNLYYSTLMIDASLKNILFEEEFGIVDYDWMLRLFENRQLVEINLNLMNRYVNGNVSLRHDCRMKNYYYSLYILEKYSRQYPKETAEGIRNLTASLGKYYYSIGRMTKARKCFLKSLSFKSLLYYLTSFLGHKYIKRKFNIYG